MLCIMYLTIVFINIKRFIIKEKYRNVSKKSIFYNNLFQNSTKIIILFKNLYIKIYII